MSTSHHHVTRTDALVVGDIIRSRTDGTTHVVEDIARPSGVPFIVTFTAEADQHSHRAAYFPYSTFDVLCGLDHGTVAVALDGDEAHPVQPLAVGAPWNGFATPVLAEGDALALLDRIESATYIVDEDNGIAVRFHDDEDTDTLHPYIDVNGTRGVDFRNAGMTFMAVGHVNYPHEPGRLFDCPECEARCHCNADPESDPCVWCSSDIVNVCPACGEPVDYCQGHGEVGDPVGAAILAAETDGVTITLTLAQYGYVSNLLDSDDGDETAASWGIDHDTWAGARAAIFAASPYRA